MAAAQDWLFLASLTFSHSLSHTVLIYDQEITTLNSQKWQLKLRSNLHILRLGHVFMY